MRPAHAVVAEQAGPLTGRAHEDTLAVDVDVPAESRVGRRRIDQVMQDGLLVRVTNISERGAALRLPRQTEVPAPEHFTLRLTWNDTEHTTLSARIRDVRRGPGGDRLLGVVFTNLSREQRLDLRKHIYAAAPDEEPLPGTST